MDRVAIKLWAKEKARNNKWNVWKGCLVICGVSFGFSIIATLLLSIVLYLGGSADYESFNLIDIAAMIGFFAIYIMVIGFSMNIYRYLKRIVQDGVADLNELKISLGHCFKLGLGNFAVIVICMLGFLALIVPGIILILGLSMVPYLLANYPDLSISEAIKTSWQMMRGKKRKYLVLMLSFYGWIILSGLTLGILFIWLLPYIILAVSKFFLEIENEFYGIVTNEDKINDHDVEEFALLNNLKLDTRNNVYGMFNDFPVVVMFGNPNGDLTITIDTVGENRGALDEYFSNLKTVLPNIMTINYSDGRITVGAKRNEELHEVYEILNRITLKLRDLDFFPSCGTCHRHQPTAFYEYRGQLLNMCDDCKNAISTNLTEDVVENSAKGIVGALIGALIGGALWAIIYQFGFITALVGYLIVFLAVNGYQLMAGKISKKGLIIAIICSVLALIGAEAIALALSIKDMMQLYSVFTAFSYLPYFLSFTEVVTVVIKDLLLGLLFMGIGSWQYIYKIKKGLEQEQLNKLD